MKKNRILIIAIIVVVIGGPMGYWAWYMTQPGKYDNFATCIAESGATFYGTYWCPHCQEQKVRFGKSEALLPYVECSLPNRQGQTQVCTDANITGYPTWEFAGGSRVSGTQAFETLSEKTGCELPS